MEILITICGRGGSKGIPGKNIRLMNGKPLIAYTIEHARQFSLQYPSDISLSTDSNEIREVAAVHGLETGYVRPDYLATDKAGKVDVIRDLKEYEEGKNVKSYDYVLDLDISAPLRTATDLIEGFGIILKDRTAYNLFSVSKANRNPYFNMVEQKENGYYDLIKKGDARYASRQTSPPVFDMNASFYVYSKQFFQLGIRSAVTNRSLIYLMDHISFDLDHEIDFEFLEYLLKNGKLGFEI